MDWYISKFILNKEKEQRKTHRLIVVSRAIISLINKCNKNSNGFCNMLTDAYLLPVKVL